MLRWWAFETLREVASFGFSDINKRAAKGVAQSLYRATKEDGPSITKKVSFCRKQRRKEFGKGQRGIISSWAKSAGHERYSGGCGR